MLRQVLPLLLFLIVILVIIRSSVAKDADFWSTLIWLLLAAIIYKTVDLALPGVYHRYIEKRVAIRPAGKAKLIIHKTNSGEYRHHVSLPVEIEVRRGGGLIVTSNRFDTDIGHSESPCVYSWEMPAGGVQSCTFSFELCRPQPCSEVNGRFSLLSDREERLTLRFRARADS